jgi:hypothetical protein
MIRIRLVVVLHPIPVSCAWTDIDSVLMLYTASLYELLVQHLISTTWIIFAHADGLTSHLAALAMFCATTRI